MSSGRIAQWRWQIIGFAGLVVFLLIAYLVLKLAPDWFANTNGLDAKGQADERQAVRTASLALLAGTVGVIGAIYTARTFALNRAGQITDRFTKAIEQLGDEALDVRLGGIYALERIARDSKEDHPQVMEVLTAYVREHAGRGGAAQIKAEGPPGPPGPPVSTDIQAVLTVLDRRTAAHDKDTVPVLDLSGTHLRWARLEGANFSRTDFSWADLRLATLDRANLVEANLRGITLDNAHLSDADLTRADLTDASFLQALAVRANRSSAQLERAVLRYARFEEAVFDKAVLFRADLRECTLVEASFVRADLTGADLRGANLTQADLSAAKLVGAKLDGATLTAARFNDSTTWPDGFDPEAAGAGA